MALATGYFNDLLRLTDWLTEGVALATRLGHPVLLSRVQAGPALDPLDFFTRARQTGLPAFFWERADDQFGLATAGQVQVFEGEGSSRFETIERQWQALRGQALIETTQGDQWGIGPLLVGGFSFDATSDPTDRWQGYPAGRLILPELQLARRADGTFLTLNTLVEATTDLQAEALRLSRLCAQLLTPRPGARAVPAALLEQRDVLPAQDWKNLVAQAVTAIRQGSFQKVVLAREVRLKAADPLDLGAALGRLRRHYPGATLFAVAEAGTERCFLGATPERLVRLADGEVRTIGLAGSAPRGQTEAEDYRLGAELLNSTKNQEEHAIVVRMLRAALERVGCHVWAENEPHLLKLSNVQHLYTPVLGRLPTRAQIGILKLVELLHPTPALGGFPRETALTWLRRHEGLDRGWYAAPVGWLDGRGEGEFVVAIRSALVEGDEASLYAGCGIVADSDPDSEYAESRLKLRPMLTALGF